MHHGMANFNAGREAVHNQPSRLAFQNVHQIASFRQIGAAPVHGRGQLSLQRRCQPNQPLPVCIANDQRARPKNFLRKLGMS